MNYELNEVANSAPFTPAEDNFSAASGDTSAGVIVAATIGDNRKVRAADLIFDASICERRGCSGDDLERAKVHASNPDCWRPIPVVERDGQVLAVDSSVFLSALCEINPDAIVEVVFVTREQAILIRIADNQQRIRREKMAPSRRAMLLSRAGWSHESIATLLGVKVSRVSQMIAEAQTEEFYEELARLIRDRFAVPARFWQDVYATRAARERMDRDNPVTFGPTRVEEFDAMIDAVVAKGEEVSVEELRHALPLNQRRAKQPGRRARMIGEPVQVDGTDIEIRVAREREGGQIINFPLGYPSEKFEKTLMHVLAVIARQAGVQPDSN